MPAAASPPKTTPLHGIFQEMGARLVDYAGWIMPVQFSSIIQEHQTVRRCAGLFDVSHMGEIEIIGSEALALVQKLTCNDAARLEKGQVQYSALTTERGTFVDDILVYRRGDDRFLLVVNAANTPKAFAWVRGQSEGTVDVNDVSSSWAQIALQGPRAAAILGRTGVDPSAIGRFRFAETRVGGVPALLSRTGYTGEDGYEIYLAPDEAAGLYRSLLDAGREDGLLPCGLGARDTLRLEAGMRLYGQDIDETTTVLEAGLESILRLQKGDFLGREALTRQQHTGVDRRLAGFLMIDRGIPRRGHDVLFDGAECGRVTSGTFGPSVGKGIGLAYVPARLARTGSRVRIAIRGREAAAEIVPTPFIRGSH